MSEIEIEVGQKWMNMQTGAIATIVDVSPRLVEYEIQHENCASRFADTKEVFNERFYPMSKIDDLVLGIKKVFSPIFGGADDEEDAIDDTVTASDICQQAIDIMAERGKTYDKSNGAERSMAKTVAAFNSLTGHNLTEEQGWQFMTVLKLARSQQGEYKADNYIDGAAYFALAGECAGMANDMGEPCRK